MTTQTLPLPALNDSGLVDRLAAETAADHRASSPGVAGRDEELVRLASLVLSLHDDEHTGPARYCSTACSAADLVLHEGR